MNTRPYKIMFFLLATSVVAILGLQAVWLRSFYRQKQEEFSQTIYSVLEKVTLKLREREGLKVFKHNITYTPGTTGVPGLSSHPPPLSLQVVNRGMHASRIIATDVHGLKDCMNVVLPQDSTLTVYPGPSVAISKTITSEALNKYEMSRIMDKIVTEIRISDNDERDPDTLGNVIRRAMHTKGLFLPFEFALKKVFKNKDETLAHSGGFDESRSSFIGDLSAENIFSTHNFLFLQFPDQNSYVMASMRSVLLLSLALSLLIVAAFYYTLRLIMKQKKLSEIRNDFVNNMTHEFKTPIATNSLAIDALANPSVKDDEQRYSEYLRVLKEENNKLNSHVERVLQMALLDKGDLPLNMSPLLIRPLIEAVISQFTLRIRQKGAEVSLSGEGSFRILGDESHLAAVMSNLLDNALKYSGDNCRVHIDISQRQGWVQIRVNDNGIGVPKEHAARIFDRFYRVQGGNLHDVKGFGLGLSYVKSIVEAHGGSISLKSQPAKGSSFIIYFRSHEPDIVG